MSRKSPYRVVLLAALSVSWLCSIAYAVDSESLSENQKKYRITELEKTDEFNIRVALKRAIEADSPEELFHWHNPHTNHRGTIVTLNSIGPRDNGQTCVDLVHVYYSGGTSAARHETTVCRDGAGNWNDTRAQTTSSTPTHLQLYAEQTVEGVQNALAQLRYAPGSVDGIYGSRTRRAIEDFQRDEGMSVNGNITDELLIALKQTVMTLDGQSSKSKTEPPQSTPTGPSLSRSPVPGPTKSLSTQDISGVVPPDSFSTDKSRAQADAESPVVVKAASTAAPKKPSLLPSTTSPPITAETSSKDVASDPVDSAQKSSILGERALTGLEQLKNLAKVVGPFDSIWYFAIAGFAMCCIVGAFASWFFTPKVNSIGTHRTQLEQAEEELNAKIALVTRRFDQTSVSVVEPPGDDIKAFNPPPTTTQQKRDFEQRTGSLEQQHGETTLSVSEETDTTQAPPDKVAVNDTWVKEQSERVEPTLVKKAERQSTENIPTPSQDATETIKQADDFIDIIEAIREAEELIKEAQRFLKTDSIERASQDYITNAIKQATEVIKEALRSGSIEGSSSQEVTKALKNASQLIKNSLTKDAVDGTSQLRLT